MGEFWATFQKVINWLFVILLVAIIGLGVLAYIVVKKAFRRVDVLVTTVKTATNRTVDSLVETFRASQGVLQGIQHKVGDFIAVLEKSGKQGIYRVEKQFRLVREDVDRVQHFVTDGDWKNTQIYADFDKAVHQVTDTLLHAPAYVYGRVNGTSTDDFKMHFKVKDMNSGVVTLLDGATVPDKPVDLNGFNLGNTTVELVTQAVTFTEKARRQTIRWKNTF